MRKLTPKQMAIALKKKEYIDQAIAKLQLMTLDQLDTCLHLMGTVEEVQIERELCKKKK